MGNRDRAIGAILGLAVGDALGTTVEFQSRGSFEPVTGIVGGGPFDLPAGAWTDDTSMALCLAESLVECEVFDLVDQTKRYVKWYRDGYWSSTESCFDIGNTTREALERFEHTGKPSGGNTKQSAGNGSIMRLAPVPVFYANDIAAAVYYAGESSKSTHALPVCVDACRLLGAMIAVAINGGEKEEILRHPLPHDTIDDMRPEIGGLCEVDWNSFHEGAILSDGYVVNTMRAAIWSFATTESFEDAVLRAVNLGDDADTTGAVCGQLAGAYYGEAQTPSHLRSGVLRADEISDLARKLCDKSEAVLSRRIRREVFVEGSEEQKRNLFRALRVYREALGLVHFDNQDEKEQTATIRKLRHIAKSVSYKRMKDWWVAITGHEW